ncbi:MAG: TMEM175 family protein [Cyanobacteria bacterium P01_H01_bin.15]
MPEELSNSPILGQVPEKDTQLLERLKRLSDGIFLLAMMLMVLQFDLPELAEKLSASQLREFLRSELTALYIYFLTFILIAFYWLSHTHQFKFFVKTDGVHTWLTLFSLMFVVLVPYTNDLSTLYPLNSDIQIFYSINLFLVGIFSWLSWCYGSVNHRLVSPELPPSEAQFISIESLIEPILCLLSIGASLLNPGYWEWTFYLIIPAYLLLSRKNQKKSEP